MIPLDYIETRWVDALYKRHGEKTLERVRRYLERQGKKIEVKKESTIINIEQEERLAKKGCPE